MDQQPTQYPPEHATLPPAVWGTLTETQQEAVRQTLVLVCQQLLTDWNREATDDSDRHP